MSNCYNSSSFFLFHCYLSRTFLVFIFSCSLIFRGIAESDSVYCDRCYRIAWSVCMYVCVSSITFVHPAKAVGRNEMLFTRVVPSNVVLNRALSPTGSEDLGVGVHVRSDGAYRKITLKFDPCFITGWAVAQTCCISQWPKYRKRGNFDHPWEQNP